MSRIGVELGPRTLRAVRVQGDEPRTFEADCDADAPGPAVADLAEALGTAGAVTVAIHPALLRVRHLELPPLPPAERRRAVALESDRYFAVSEPLAVSFAGDYGLTFAVSEGRLEGWLDALRRLGPVTRLEPAGTAVARALARNGTGDADLLEDLGDGVAWSRIRDGRVTEARRVFGGLEAAVEALPVPEAGLPVHIRPWPDTDVPEALANAARPAPGLDGLPDRFLAAYGAAMDPEMGWEDGFVTTSLQRELGRRRLRRRAGAVVAAVVAVVFALLSWDAQRGRVETKIDARIADLREAALPVQALEEDVAALQRSLETLYRIDASRADVLGTLRALTNVMPEDTWLRTINVSGDDWQVQGVGQDAAALIPLLEADPRFENVEFAAATRRVQMDNTTYDDFALAFRTTRPAE